jgi:hypothetical protein
LSSMKFDFCLWLILISVLIRAKINMIEIRTEKVMSRRTTPHCSLYNFDKLRYSKQKALSFTDGAFLFLIQHVYIRGQLTTYVLHS